MTTERTTQPTPGGKPTGRPARRTAQRLSAQNTGLLLAVALFVVVIGVYLALYGARQGALPGGFELTSTVNNATPLIFAALGQAFVVLTGGLDLSVGGLMDLTNSVAATHMHDSAGSIALWGAVILLIGAGTGLVNGVLVAYGRLQPILVTLGTLAILQGLALKVLPQPGGTVPAGLTHLVAHPDRPYGLAVVALAGLIWFVVRRTPLGVSAYAIGNDRQAARAGGIRVQRMTVLVYVTSGVLVAAGGLLLAAATTGGDATSGDVFTLTSIAAVVVGGVSLFGGRGNGVGAIIGAFVLTILINVLFFAHIDPLYEPLAEGLFLILAAALTALLGILLRRVLRTTKEFGR
ncbi:MAG TPA: ABC transporter permease [Streptosporangiaceae bacterium]